MYSWQNNTRKPEKVSCDVNNMVFTFSQFEWTCDCILYWDTWRQVHVDCANREWRSIIIHSIHSHSLASRHAIYRPSIAIDIVVTRASLCNTTWLACVWHFWSKEKKRLSCSCPCNKHARFSTYPLRRVQCVQKWHFILEYNDMVSIVVMLDAPITSNQIEFDKYVCILFLWCLPSPVLTATRQKNPSKARK